VATQTGLPSQEQFERGGDPGGDSDRRGPLSEIVPAGWDVERIVGLMAGTFTLLSLAMGRLHHRRWRLMTVLIGGNLIFQAFSGWCPSSLVLRRLGVPSRR
jgi:hypothetical protein